jgi:hypothetical protein
VHQASERGPADLARGAGPHRAREDALTAEKVASPLARRPYDLRYAAVSTWLNAGVPSAQVAEWAGHSWPDGLHQLGRPSMATTLA